MKKQLLLAGAALTLGLAGCSDNVTENLSNPIQTGEEIVFGSTINNGEYQKANGIQTKTIYAERIDHGIPVLWDPEGDEIAIVCPQALGNTKRADYLVKPDTTTTNWNQSGSVAKLDPSQTLKWGEEDAHKFFAFYPQNASILKDYAIEGENVNFTISLPATQNPTGWHTETDENTQETTIYEIPNMDYALMWAYNKVYKSKLQGKSINLDFKNFVTVLDITIPGPKNEHDAVTINNIVISPTDPSQQLTGDFKATIIPPSATAHHDIASMKLSTPTPNGAHRQISISCVNKDNQGITLKHNEKLVIKAYLCPKIENYNLDTEKINLSFRISTNKETLTINHVPTHITNSKVNRILLPNIKP